MGEQKRRTILFVCTGNTCRSPMAVGLVKKLAGAEKYILLSAGTASGEGMPPSSHAREVMEEEGVDISDHRSRMLDADLLEQADDVLVMAESHRRQIADWFKSYAKKTRLIREFDTVRDDRDYPNVPDPIGLGKKAYIKCKNMIKRSLERALQEL
jgi:glycine hydroxymethyltransferase